MIERQEMTTQDIQEEAVVMTTQDDAAIDAAPASTDSAIDESTQAQDVLETYIEKIPDPVPKPCFTS